MSVDGYGIACGPVRDMFVDYLRERQPGLDYKTIRSLATKLILLFWKDLELHHPGIDSLHLDDAVARAWKERLRHVRYGNHKLGQERQDPYAILMAVRAFYADLSHWALEDPARWASWAAPSPVDSRDLAGMTKFAKHRQSWMHQRIRELAPLLPRLVDIASERRSNAGALLSAARQVAPGELFTAAGQTLRRTALATDPELGGGGRPGVIYATAPEGTGPRRNLLREDERAFWAWTCVEVFRHTGVRIEEMLEITHRSFVSYTPAYHRRSDPHAADHPVQDGQGATAGHQPGTGQRLRPDHPPRPWRQRTRAARHPIRPRRTAPQPAAALPVPASVGTEHHRDHAHPREGTPRRARRRSRDHQPRRHPRRLQSTRLPAPLRHRSSGIRPARAHRREDPRHDSIATTQTYIAVYDQDVIDHHRAFIARRRQLRPSEEYREPTDSEWDEFLGHFAKRKIELGTCGRAYGTSCQHELACIRCPMLRPDPAQQQRLEDIIASLPERITEAHEHGWLGEVEGLQTSLTAAEQKLVHMRRTAINLGLPIMPPNRERRTR